MMLQLAELIAAAPGFSIVFARVCSAVLFLPGLGEAVTPVTVRVGLAISFSLLIAPVLPRDFYARHDTGLDYAVIVLTEVITGLWFGWMVRLIAGALGLAGQLTGYMVGLSSVLQPDPELGGQSNAFGSLFSLSAPLIFLSTGLYYYPLRGLVGLYDLIPAGQLAPAADTMEEAVRAVAVTFDLALQVAAPFIVVGILWHFVTGQIARVAARMQIYFMSMPGQILAGLALLCMTARLLVAAWYQGADAQLRILSGTG